MPLNEQNPTFNFRFAQSVYFFGKNSKNHKCFSLYYRHTYRVFQPLTSFKNFSLVTQWHEFMLQNLALQFEFSLKAYKFTIQENICDMLFFTKNNIIFLKDLTFFGGLLMWSSFLIKRIKNTQFFSSQTIQKLTFNLLMEENYVSKSGAIV